MNRNVYIISATLVLLFFLGMAVYAFRLYGVSADSVFGGVSSEEADTVTVVTDVKYGNRERNTLDIYMPSVLDKSAEHGLILYIHGGSWTSGDKSSMASDCRLLAEAGYITATMNYSFLDMSGEEKSDFTTMLAEIAAALATVKGYAAANGINITKAALSGYSAGAHLAMLYGYSMTEQSPLPVAFIQSKAGPADFRTFDLKSADAQELLAKMGGGAVSPEEVTKSESFINMMLAISPVSHVKAGVPPTLLAYGEKDTLVVWANVLSLVNAFNVAGVKYELVKYPNSGHGLDMDPDSDALRAGKMSQFAKQYFGY